MGTKRTIEGASLLTRRIWRRALGFLAAYLAIYAAAVSTFPRQLEELPLSIRLIALLTGPIAIFVAVSLVSVVEWFRWRGCEVSFEWGGRTFEFQTWSGRPELLLRPRDVDPTRTAPPPAQDWLTDRDSLELHNVEALAQHQTGLRTAYLVGLVLPNPEIKKDRERRRLRWQVAPGDYAKFLATRSYLRSPEGAPDQQRIRDKLEKDWPEALKTAPPSIVAVNVSVVSDEGSVLALRRSNIVATARSVWTVGPHETMNWIDPDRPLGESGPETAFTLAERALKEELHLDRDHYGPILFSWFGLYLPDACVYLFGHVRSRLEAIEIKRRVPQSEGSYETLDAGNAVSWVPYECKSFQNILTAVRNTTADSSGRHWVEFAPFSLEGLWRMRPLLMHRDYFRLFAD
jgi:hypothetical protein